MRSLCIVLPEHSTPYKFPANVLTYSLHTYSLASGGFTTEIASYG